MGNYLEAFSNVLSEQAALSQNGTGPKDVIPQPVVPTDEERQQWMKEQANEVFFLRDHKIIAEFDSIALVANSKGLGAKANVSEPSNEKQQPISVSLEWNGEKTSGGVPIGHRITLFAARGENGKISGVRFPFSTDSSKIIPPNPKTISELVTATVIKSLAKLEPLRPKPSELVLTAPSLSL